MPIDLLTLGTRGVLTAQSQLNVVSHNIDNVNTEGYTRQMANQRTSDPMWQLGNNYGTGSYLSKIERQYDQFAINSMNMASTEYHYYDQRDSQLGAMDGLLSQTGQKIKDSMNLWYDTVNKLSDSPSDMGTRRILLNQAKLVTGNMNDVYARLEQDSRDTNESLEIISDKISAIGIEMAENNKILTAAQASETADNDLIDRQEILISELSSLTQVSARVESNGSYSVYIGNGINLVSNVRSNVFSMADGDPDKAQTRFSILTEKGAKLVTSQEIGGKVQALLDHRDKTITKVKDQLGLMSLSFAKSMDDLQRQGLDLNGKRGADFFTNFNSKEQAKDRVLSPASGDYEVYIDDLSALEGGEYQLRLASSEPVVATDEEEVESTPSADEPLALTGTEYIVIDPRGNERLVTTNENNELVVDGLRIKVNQDAQEGEKVFIRTTRDAARDIKVLLTDAKEIAAQGYVSNASNVVSSAHLSLEPHMDLQNFPTNFDVKINKLESGEYQYSVQNATDRNGRPVSLQGLSGLTGSYDPSNGVTFSLGIPQVQAEDTEEETSTQGEDETVATSSTRSVMDIEITAGAINGDTFAINLSPSEGDNSNLLKMAKIQQEEILNGGNSSIIDVFESVTTDIGNEKSIAHTMEEVGKVNWDSTQEKVASVSGVNLDEEAADLMRFQQSYAASSKVMAVADEIFNTILNIGN